MTIINSPRVFLVPVGGGQPLEAFPIGRATLTFEASDNSDKVSLAIEFDCTVEEMEKRKKINVAYRLAAKAFAFLEKQLACEGTRTSQESPVGQADANG